MTCDFDGCGRVAEKRGLCGSHAMQKRRGRPLMAIGSYDRSATSKRVNAERWGNQIDRFWSYVDKNGPIVRAELGPCWTWAGPVDSHGYGQLVWNGRLTLATHVSLEVAGRPLKERCALHRCDNPPCPNPDHLFGGTHKDNYDDMISKGRGVRRRGTESGRAKIDEDDAAEIRVSRESSLPLSIRYGLSRPQICNIKRGTSWTHVRMD